MPNLVFMNWRRRRLLTPSVVLLCDNKPHLHVEQNADEQQYDSWGANHKKASLGHQPRMWEIAVRATLGHGNPVSHAHKSKLILYTNHRGDRWNFWIGYECSKSRHSVALQPQDETVTYHKYR